MGKITVKHYINKDLKPVGGLYPLYVQIIYNRKVYKIKSFITIFEYVNEEILKTLKTSVVLEQEIRDIERTILDLEKQGKGKVTSKNITQFAKPFTEIVEDNFCKVIKKELPEAPYFLTSSKFSDIDDLLFFFGIDFATVSKKINILLSNIENLKIEMYKTDKYFLGIDFYNGENLEKIKDKILNYVLQFGDEDEVKEEAEKVLQYFRELIEI